MGYANMDQRGQGIHMRQFSRAFILQDSNGRRVVYASVEVGMISHAMRRDVIKNFII
jgi:neutral ceramidase